MKWILRGFSECALSHAERQNWLLMKERFLWDERAAQSRSKITDLDLSDVKLKGQIVHPARNTDNGGEQK
jgi:hypothetical protein